jgi:hypothetical protein
MTFHFAIALLVMLSVLAIIITSSFFLFSDWKLKVFPGCGALAMATLFYFYLTVFWLAPWLPPPTLCSLALGGILGGLAGLVVALLIERRSYSRAAKPVDTAVKRVDTPAKPPDTAVQRLDKRDPEH